MNKTILFQLLFLFLPASGALAQDRYLPFTMSVTEMTMDNHPDFLTPHSPDAFMDFPVSTAMIDGSFWVMFKNGDTKNVFRFKGANFEDEKRQAGGTLFAPVTRPYILGGMWYDSADGKLYAPMHCETRGYYTTILRQIHLATSADKGITWKYEGPLVTRDDPKAPLPTGRESSGQYWDGGEGDFLLYVDTRGGYFYLYTNTYTFAKPGVNSPPFFRHHVARCRISDKMAPGKWQKFYNGAWGEPGLGGKASDVDAYYVMYNTYLGKYISFNCDNSISVCDDLSRQDWTPCIKIPGKYWGNTDAFAWLVTDAGKTDTYTGGKTLFLYSYWEKAFHGLYKIDFGPGKTPDTAGYMVGYAWGFPTSAEPMKLYLYGSRYESSDSIERMHCRRVDCLNPQTAYSGIWTEDTSDSYYGKTAMETGTAKNSMQFSFRGKDIYWRAVKGPDGGKADVYLDDVFQKTVDCWASPVTPFQFAFIKRGLDPTVTHIIKVVVRGDKNPRSTGTEVRHLLFQYSADSYCASDGFSNVMGKNNWYYQQGNNGVYTDMVFRDPYWAGSDSSEVGYFHMTPGKGDAVRKWVAPQMGRIRVEGNIKLENDSTGTPSVEILKNNRESCWASGSVDAEKPLYYDFTIPVKQGDAVYFIVKREGGNRREKVIWDPAVTYVP